MPVAGAADFDVRWNDALLAASARRPIVPTSDSIGEVLRGASARCRAHQKTLGIVRQQAERQSRAEAVSSYSPAVSFFSGPGVRSRPYRPCVRSASRERPVVRSTRSR